MLVFTDMERHSSVAWFLTSESEIVQSFIFKIVRIN